MEQIKLAELHLASARQNFDDFLKPNLLDAEETESAMTKTDTGYVYEIRYKQPGKMFIADAITINGVYEKLGEFMSLDKMREAVEGMATQVGRLANAVKTVKAPSFAEKKPLKVKKK